MIIPSYKSKIDSINKMYNDEIRRCNGEERYLSLIDEYYKLIDDCSTEPKRMAQEIHSSALDVKCLKTDKKVLTDRVKELEEIQENERKAYDTLKAEYSKKINTVKELKEECIKVDKECESYIDTINDLYIKVNQPLYKIFYDKINKWLFGAKGTR